MPKAVCPICGKEYMVTEEKLEKTAMWSMFHYDYNPIKIVDGKRILYWPCSKCEKIFEKVIEELSKKAREAEKYVRSKLDRIRRELREKVIEEAEKVAKELIEKLKPGEGLVFWVCEDSYKTGKPVREIAFVYVKLDDKGRFVYGKLEPDEAWRPGCLFATTHYVSRELAMEMDKFPEVKWKGFIQGALIEDVAKLKHLLHEVFMATHSDRYATLVDILRGHPDHYAIRAEKIWEEEIEKSPYRESVFYYLTHPYALYNKISAEAEKKYGVRPGSVRVEHLLKYLKEHAKELGLAPAPA